MNKSVLLKSIMLKPFSNYKIAGGSKDNKDKNKDKKREIEDKKCNNKWDSKKGNGN